MEKRVIDISWASLWRIVAIFLLVVTLFYVRDVIIVVFIAIIISSALHAPVSYLEEKKIPRILSVITIYLLAAATVALVLYAMVPVMLIQARYFLDHVNELKLPFLDMLGMPNLISQINTNINDWISTLFYGGSNLLNFISAVAGNLVFMFVTAVLSLYLTISRGSIQRFIRAIMPTNKEEYTIDLYKRTRRKIGRWFTSQLILSFVVGALTFIGLLVLGIDSALLLSILAAILEIIPYVGPIAVGVVTFLVALPQSTTLAFLAIILFFLIHQLENHVLVPLIVGKAVGIDPVMVVIAILAGSQLAGLVGAVIAVPAAIIVQELVDDWSAKKNGNQKATAS